MSEENWRTISGVMMTTERVEAYGGMRFDREFLESAAASIKSRGLPMHLEHHRARPIRTRSFDAFVGTRPDGIHALLFTFEIHPDDAHWATALGRFSAMMTSPIGRSSDYLKPDAPQISISADHAWFEDESILETESAIQAAGVPRETISAERALQFSFVPDPQIFVGIAVDLLTGIGSSAIWEAVLSLFRSRRVPPGGDAGKPTIINITLIDGEASLTAVVETGSESVALRALDSIDGLVRSVRDSAAQSGSSAHTGSQVPQTSTVVWDDNSRAWTPPT